MGKKKKVVQHTKSEVALTIPGDVSGTKTDYFVSPQKHRFGVPSPAWHMRSADSDSALFLVMWVMEQVTMKETPKYDCFSLHELDGVGVNRWDSYTVNVKVCVLVKKVDRDITEGEEIFREVDRVLDL